MSDMVTQDGCETTESRNWLKLVIQCDPQLVDAISDFLVGVIEAGVETGAVDEPLYGTVNAYIGRENLSDDEIGAMLDQVQGYLKTIAGIFAVRVPQLSYELLGEQDWSRNWKTHFKPFAIIPGLVIAPTWETYTPAADEKVITMDPGMAFGTGHHATTSLCLELIARSLDEAGETAEKKRDVAVLDVGTGTGILGMAAVLLGAGTVTALDNDEDAVDAARENAALNGLASQMSVSSEVMERISSAYELVVANIVHDVLVELAPELARLTQPGGTLVLSGILAGAQQENLIRLFGEKGFSLVDSGARLEWVALRFRKSAAA